MWTNAGPVDTDECEGFQRIVGGLIHPQRQARDAERRVTFCALALRDSRSRRPCDEGRTEEFSPLSVPPVALS